MLRELAHVALPQFIDILRGQYLYPVTYTETRVAAVYNSKC